MSDKFIEQFKMNKDEKPRKGRQEIKLSGANQFDPNANWKIPASELKEIEEQEEYFATHDYIAPERRDPAVLLDRHCDKCRKPFKVYPSQLTVKLGGDENDDSPRAEYVYVCGPCSTRRGRR